MSKLNKRVNCIFILTYIILTFFASSCGNSDQHSSSISEGDNENFDYDFSYKQPDNDSIVYYAEKMCDCFVNEMDSFGYNVNYYIDSNYLKVKTGISRLISDEITLFEFYKKYGEIMIFKEYYNFEEKYLIEANCFKNLLKEVRESDLSFVNFYHILYNNCKVLRPRKVITEHFTLTDMAKAACRCLRKNNYACYNMIKEYAYLVIGWDYSKYDFDDEVNYICKSEE